MTSVELRWFYKKLLETKDAENKAREDAMKEAKAARDAARAANQNRPKHNSSRVRRRH